MRSRALESSDREGFVEAFAQLSPDSRYLRFGAAKPRLSQREVDYLVHVDHHDHEALVALECETGEPLGIARFVRPAPDADRAEVAVTVLDAWQGNGIGPRLVEALIERARAEGIRTVYAEVLLDNARALRLLARLGFVPVGTDGGLVRYERPTVLDPTPFLTLRARDRQEVGPKRSVRMRVGGQPASSSSSVIASTNALDPHT